MRSTTIIGFLSALTFGLVLGCHDPAADDCNGPCECVGDDCVCPASGECWLHCTAECDLECTGSANCVYECGEGCVVDCAGSGLCAGQLGPDGLGRCTGTGDCGFFCDGPCKVECPADAGNAACGPSCPAEFPIQECSYGYACGPC